MSFKPKLVKERLNQLHVDSDLRGIGIDVSAHNNLEPEPILTIEHSNLLISDLMLDLGIVKNESKWKHKTDLVVESKNLTHKEKSINLFAFALISYKKNKTESFLWLNNKLYNYLADNIENHNENKISNVVAYKNQDLNQITNIMLEEPIQIYLKQAGFNFEKSVEILILNDNDIKNHFENFKNMRSNQSHLSLGRAI